MSGQPNIFIEFATKGVTAIERSTRGIVAVILKDSTNTSFDEKTYSSFDAVSSAHWTAKNLRLLSLIFLGGPFKVIVRRLASDASDDSAALTALTGKLWNWLVIPGASTARADAAVSFIKAQRTAASAGGPDRTYKLVTYGPTAMPESEGIVVLKQDDDVVGVNGKLVATAHGCVDGEAVTIIATTYPGGLQSGMTYYCKDLESTNKLKLAQTLGGTTVDIFSDGEDVQIRREKACTAEADDDTFTCAAHGLVNNDIVQFTATSLPTGLSLLTDYHVINKATNTFQVSETEGGAAVNFSTDSSGVKWNRVIDATIEYGDTYDGSEYAARVAGILAGLPLNRSATYFVLSDLQSTEALADDNADVNLGYLTLVDDGVKLKIGRAVNSYSSASWTPTKGEDFSKIKIIEGIDMVKDDIRTTFADSDVGKVLNSYDYKMLFFQAVKGYLAEVARPNIGVIDAAKVTTVDIDQEAQDAYIRTKISEEDFAKLSLKERREYNTGSKVYCFVDTKFADAMEDLIMRIQM
jgi:hypothetical protein